MSLMTYYQEIKSKKIKVLKRFFQLEVVNLLPETRDIAMCIKI